LVLWWFLYLSVRSVYNSVVPAGKPRLAQYIKQEGKP